MHSLETGRRAARPWCALALGVLANAAPQPEVRTALRAAMKRDKNREHVPAYLLASGLARDRRALPEIRKTFFEAKNAQVRIAAAHALALIRGPAVRAELLKPLPTIHCTFQRGAIAEVLGYIGNPDDTKLLGEMLDGTNDTRERTKIAAALGHIGTPAAVELLFGAAADEARDIRVRGTALRALGQMLTDRPTHTLAHLVARSNYVTLPDWFRNIAGLTL
jgi:HEAT repeat protein